MEDGFAKLDMISLAPSNSSSKQLDSSDKIPMSLPETSDQSTRSNPDAKIKAFEEFVEEPLHVDPPQSSCWTFSFFQQFFDVKSVTVRQRLLRSIVPLSSEDFFAGEKPDMYGPFWLVTTLVCAITIVGNEVDGETGYDVGLVAWSAGVLYGVAAGIPLSAYCLLRGSSDRAPLVRLLSLYCYSYTVFIPCCFVTILLNWALTIAVTVAAVFWSLFFLLRNGYQGTADLDPGTRSILTVLVAGGHFGIGSFLCWYLLGNKI